MRLLNILLIASVLCAASCNKYVDVDPKSSLSDEQLFSSEIGFQQALSGVYSQLAARSLFGDNLSMGFVSALGQNYNQTTTDRFGQVLLLNYTAQAFKDYSNATWTAAYQAIAGINHLLLNLEKKKEIFSEVNYTLIKGEATALRAYMHFELLRLYGTAYVNDPNKKAIPYETSADAEATIPATTDAVTNLALADLKTAEILLQTVDNIIPALVNSRRYKMNYYAVKALEARIRLFKGDLTGATAAAKVVVGSGRFPLIDPTAQYTTASMKDRLFTPELVFALRNKNIKNWSEVEYFKANGGSSLNRLTRSTAHLNGIYESSTFDIRKTLLFETDNTVLFPSKFWQTDTYRLDTSKVDQAIPLIRVSELYYILAETAPTPAEGVVYLNAVRKARNLTEFNISITATDLRNELTKEFNKEFYAEGQTFFYYKRLNMTKIPDQVNNVYSRAVTAQSYILPIPDAELEFNPNY